ncbi:MAG: hypothetical protein EU541_00710 [Promethearchaeota archaeon]|nr:MAG: hypothetical protein EU541_00710 [Candidatus Lokiarchaeota archaeon]
MKVLRDIWILDKAGIVVFHRTFEELDAQLFGGLMSALNSFSKNLSEEGLTSFELSDKRFAIYRRSEFLFVGNSANKIKEKRIFQELEVIADKFFQIYGTILDKWQGDINVFSNFENHIEDSLEGTINKFEKAFW